jgi:hypothetical protein
VPGPPPLVDGWPGLLTPMGNRGFIMLPSPMHRLLRAPAKLVEQATHMLWMIGNAKFQIDDGGDPTAGPELSAEAIGRGTPMQQRG